MSFFRARIRLWPVVVISAIVIAAAIAASLSGVLRPFGTGQIVGTQTDTKTSEVAKYSLPQQQVVLSSLRVQGIDRVDENGFILGVRVPAADRTKVLQYEFDANLGLEGSEVHIVPTSGHRYAVDVPPFIFIGNADPHFEDPIDENQILSFLTGEISQSEMTNRILSGERKDEYISDSLATLKTQTEVFYSAIVKSTDPVATLTFDFTE